MEYTINKLAKLAGVSVRTLHYYDQMGLLKPSKIRENGYRIYSSSELLRLQEILFFRELKFALVDIKKILEQPDFDRLAALEQQQKLISYERDRLTQLISTISKSITTMKGTTTMEDIEFYDGLSREEMEKYAQEAKERWGTTQAYKQSQERMSKLSQEEKQRLYKNAQKAMQDLADHMPEGPESAAVQELIDREFKGINEMFYECSIEMFRNLAEMTTTDEQYAQNYRKFHPDLPEFRLKAIQFYCDQAAKLN